MLYTGVSGLFHVAPLSWLYWAILLGSIGVALGLAKIITYFLDRSVPETDRDY